MVCSVTLCASVSSVMDGAFLIYCAVKGLLLLSLVLNEITNRRAVTRGVLLATLLVLTAIVLPIAMIRATAVAEQGRPTSSGTADKEVGPAENDEEILTDDVAAGENDNESRSDDVALVDTLIPKDVAWSEKIDGLRFRLYAPRTEFQSWQVPTFIIEVHNAGDKEITAAQAETLFGELHVKKGLQFMFPRKAKRAPTNGNRWLVPTMRLNAAKLVGLNADATIRLPVALVAKRESSTPKWGKYQLTAGRHTLGLGNFVFPEKPDYKTNTVTMHVLPPGVRDRKQLDGFLQPYLADVRRLKAGFVPHATTLV